MRTVLNKSNIPVQERIMFLGPDLSIQRYDQFKYKKFFDLWEKQENYRWRPQRVDLSKDRIDFEKMNDTERFVFESNIKFQTMVDSMLSRSIHKISEYVTNPELELCLSTWSSMEAMHSFSYTHIFKNITKDATKFFDSILENDEIVKRASDVGKSYDDLLGEPTDLKNKIFHAVLATNITESILFYNSFVCSFFFGYRGMMEGSAKIVGEIARDECVAEGTEVLTSRGWKNIEDFDCDNDLVLQFNEDRTTEFVKSKRKVEHSVDEDLIRFHNKKGYVDCLVTENHRFVYENKAGNLSEKLAKDYSVKNVWNKIFVGGNKLGGQEHLTNYERLLIAFQADGNINEDKIRNGKHSGCRAITFILTKKRKQDRLEYILGELGFEFTKSPVKDNYSEYSYYVKVPLEYTISKTFDWVEFDKVSGNWCNEFIHEMLHWDGYDRNGDASNIYYSSVVASNADVVQALACMAGFKCHRGIQIDNRSETYSDVHRLTIIPSKNTINNQCINKEIVPYKGKVYCLEVPSGMFVIRYNNRVMVTGNCLHVNITQNIIKNWRDHPEEGFQDIIRDNEELIYELFKLAVENEKGWANYLFSKGSLLGLNAEILHEYIEWLANSRLKSLGYKQIFASKKNPVSWSARYFDSSIVQVAPQESELESYLVGSANTQINDSDFDNFEL